MCLLFAPFFKHHNLFGDFRSAALYARPATRAIKNQVTVHGKHPFSNAFQKRTLPFRPAQRERRFALTGNPLLDRVGPGWRRVKRLIFSISKLDIRSVDEIYEFAICPWSGEAAAEPGTIWLVRDFLPLFPLSAPDSWMPANRGRGAWQLQAESNALMPCRATNANFLQVGEGRIRRIDGECEKGARGRWCAKRTGRSENASGSTLKRTAGKYKSERAFFFIFFSFFFFESKGLSSSEKSFLWKQ